MPEEQIRYLELIQQIILRMANNSFLVKGWSLTLVAAIFAVAAQGNTWGLVWTALLPALCFWWLDTFYLRQERLFRHLYDYAKISHAITFSMNTKVYFWREPYLKVALRPAMWPLHVAILVTIIIVGVLKTDVSSEDSVPDKPQDTQAKTTVTCNCPTPTIIVKEIPMMMNDIFCKNDDQAIKKSQHPKHCHHSQK